MRACTLAWKTICFLSRHLRRSQVTLHRSQKAKVLLWISSWLLPYMLFPSRQFSFEAVHRLRAECHAKCPMRSGCHSNCSVLAHRCTHACIYKLQPAGLGNQGSCCQHAFLNAYIYLSHAGGLEKCLLALHFVCHISPWCNEF